jgi:hypothetical protein
MFNGYPHKRVNMRSQLITSFFLKSFVLLYCIFVYTGLSSLCYFHLNVILTYSLYNARWVDAHLCTVN